MSGGSNKNNYERAIVASVGIIGVCATAIALHDGNPLWVNFDFYNCLPY